MAAAFGGFAFAFVLTDTPFCPLALFAGIPCPGCGLTRATLALLHGDVHTALRFHPLVPVLTPLFGAALLRATYDYVRGPGHTARPSAWWTGRTMTWGASILLVLVLGVWLSRFAGWFGGPVPVKSLLG